MTIEEIMEELNDLFANELDGTEAFYNLLVMANGVNLHPVRFIHCGKTVIAGRP